ncbi:MAG: NAD(P)/FAD-dependent oxidoreductase [Chloroflexi bacterium]|nr:NAD(P)/FAD-dependent oxidoreductase [Chloroflexota bacterium]
MEIVILGYGPAALSALTAIHGCPPSPKGEEIETTVITAEPHPPYSPMFLIEYAFGQVSRRQLYLPQIPSANGRLKVVAGRKATEIQANENRVLLDDGEIIPYDRLLIATGASALKPPVKGLDKPGVFFINRLDDVLRLRARVRRASNAVIVGAGAIGIETALALACQGKRVTIVEAVPQILPLMLDADLAAFVQAKLEERGVHFLLNSPVCEVLGKRRADGVVCEKEVAGDLVIVAAGFRPNMGFVNPAGIKTARGILVNDRMQTSAPNIYAAGDVAEARNPFADRYELNFTWFSALEQGRVAGSNIGGRTARLFYSPSLNVLKGLDFAVASVGQKVNPAEYELVFFADERAGTFEKVYLKGGYIEHYQSIGLPYKLGYIYNLVRNRKKVSSRAQLAIKDYSPVYVG